MHIIDILLLVVKNEGENGLRGRTLLQKKIYFLSVLMDVDLGFTPHYYGPYSSFVAAHLDGLVNYGVLKETTESFATASGEQTPWGEIRKHTYIYSIIPEVAEEVWSAAQGKPDFDEWSQKLKFINDQKLACDSNKLSIAAKVHYIVSWEGNGPLTLPQVQQIAEEYNWKIDKESIKNVLSFLEQLGLVTTDESA